MIRFLFIIASIIFLLNNANAETFSAALKKAYNENNEQRRCIKFYANLSKNNPKYV